MLDAIFAMFKSRKFLLMLLDGLQVVVFNYFEVPPEIWKTIHAALLALIIAIAAEDSALKFGLYKLGDGSRGSISTEHIEKITEDQNLDQDFDQDINQE